MYPDLMTPRRRTPGTRDPLSVQQELVLEALRTRVGKLIPTYEGVCLFVPGEREVLVDGRALRGLITRGLIDPETFELVNRERV